jgi:hypothetical protein
LGGEKWPLTLSLARRSRALMMEHLKMNSSESVACSMAG